jgi:hypothetical protein
LLSKVKIKQLSLAQDKSKVIFVAGKKTFFYFRRGINDEW